MSCFSNNSCFFQQEKRVYPRAIKITFDLDAMMHFGVVCQINLYDRSRPAEYVYTFTGEASVINNSPVKDRNRVIH